MRSGRFVKQPTGYRAFIPAPLPPAPPIVMDEEMVSLLSKADRALGRLDGVTSVLPNPDLFVAMYVRHEAVLSSQIEGTQSTLEDVLEYEIEARINGQPQDVEEVVNHVRAMNHGLQRLQAFPLSLPLIKEIHAELMRGVRGANREPGEFRRSQNWIGPEGSNLNTATFVPPPPHEMQIALDNFEKFLHTRQPIPVLIHCGLAHAQFETIHPFLDGNGRVGRLLITFLLCQREILQSPLLYLSLYLKAHRAEYYDRLTAVRTDGNWEGWLKFFLRGVAETSLAATRTARSILDLRESGRAKILAAMNNANLGQQLFDYLFEHPLITVRMVEKELNCSYVRANKLVEQFTAPEIDFIEEITGGQRNRLFRFKPYLALFDAPSLGLEESAAPTTAIQTTRSENEPVSP
jgi:Fic family protein